LIKLFQLYLFWYWSSFSVYRWIWLKSLH